MDVVERLIRQHGGELIRQRRHQIWRFPDGWQFVRAGTPSDHRALYNQLADVRRLLNLSTPPKAATQRPKPRSARPGRQTPPSITPANTVRHDFSTALKRALAEHCATSRPAPQQ